MNDSKCTKTTVEKFEVHALVSFDDCEEFQESWSRIGSARTSRDGTIELKVHIWPTNIRRLKLRPIRDHGG